MTAIDRAWIVAEKWHANQSYDIYPYMYHIHCVADNISIMNYSEEIYIAAILHDILEDTGLSYNDIKKAFNEDIANIVYAVTDEIGHNRKERKEKTYPKIRANWKAVVVKIADRIANVSHSKEYNQEKYKMYQKEHEIFKENLDYITSVNDPKTKRAWIKLNDLMKQ